MSATGIVNVTTYPVGLATPTFTYPSYTVALNSPVDAGTVVLTVTATGNGTMIYSMATVRPAIEIFLLLVLLHLLLLLLLFLP